MLEQQLSHHSDHRSTLIRVSIQHTMSTNSLSVFLATQYTVAEHAESKVGEDKPSLQVTTPAECQNSLPASQ